MPTLPDWVLRRETLAALIVAALAAGIGVALYLSQATTLTIAVAPRDGTEPALIKAYADALSQDRANIRLKVLSFASSRGQARTFPPAAGCSGKGGARVSPSPRGRGEGC